MIGQKFYKENFNQEAYIACVKWCNETQQGFMVDKGDYYECVEIIIPEPTVEELQQQLTDQVQAYIDEKAHEKNYDNGFACASYVSSSVPKFKAEADAFVLWRDQVWTYCYEQLDLFLKGDREVPTDIIAELPPLEW